MRPAARPQGGKQLLEVKPDAKLATQLQWPSTVKVSPLLGSAPAPLRGASGGSRRLDAWHGGEDRPLGAQPLPRVSSEPPPKVTDLTACDHPGGRASLAPSATQKRARTAMRAAPGATIDLCRSAKHAALAREARLRPGARRRPRASVAPWSGKSF